MEMEKGSSFMSESALYGAEIQGEARVAGEVVKI